MEDKAEIQEQEKAKSNIIIVLFKETYKFLKFLLAEIFGKRKWLYLVLIVAFVAFSAYKFVIQEIGLFFRSLDTPAKIESGFAKNKTFTENVKAIGTIVSPDSVIITPEISGIITEIYFNEGNKVFRDEPLLKIDSTNYEAELEIAKANLELAELNQKRAHELLKGKFISTQSYDETKAILRKDKASLKLAKDNLEKTTIRAPFDGITGLKNVSVGDYVSPGTSVTNLENIDILQVDFQIPERYFSRVKIGDQVNIATDLYKDKIFTGKIIAIDPQINSNDRSLRIRAQINNESEELWPGSFARVSIILETTNAIAIHESAMVKTPEGNVVFIITPTDKNEYITNRSADATGLKKIFFKMFADAIDVKTDLFEVKQIPIIIGKRKDDFIEIIEGINADDEVVTAGHQKIFDGKKVIILNQQKNDNS